MGEEAGGISPQHRPLSPLLGKTRSRVPRLRADKEGVLFYLYLDI
jgi:hypothetical protein